jgi:hypothetical protein
MLSHGFSRKTSFVLSAILKQSVRTAQPKNHICATPAQTPTPAV